MTKLSDMYKIIGSYLELHGDKQVTSIASHSVSSPFEYSFNLHDIPGNHITKLYTGRDRIDFNKSE